MPHREFERGFCGVASIVPCGLSLSWCAPVSTVDIPRELLLPECCRGNRAGPSRQSQLAFPQCFFAHHTAKFARPRCSVRRVARFRILLSFLDNSTSLGC